MSRRLRRYRLLIAAATVALALTLCRQTIDLLLTGDSAAPFTREAVAQRLSGLAIPFAVYALAVVMGIILQAQKGSKPHKRRETMVPAPDCKRINTVRAALIGAGVVLVLLGVMNDGWWDVLVKAINICTECIGLG